MTEIYVWFWDHTPAWTFEIFQSSRTVFVLFACILMYVLVQVATQRAIRFRRMLREDEARDTLAPLADRLATLGHIRDSRAADHTHDTRRAA
ncbi:hypothetical protein GCM10009765_59230 [Fodinicola feengrottensis]|uniref:Uncharacterized protein n=1 Tax=Fodinicola feengrottensis TaxID=435914 RepID=A0ABN2IBD8_9ACTN